MLGLLGIKLGMTRIFDQQNLTVTPVTIIKAGPCPIVQIKSKEKDGYTALQLGFGEKKEKNINRPQMGHFKKAGVAPLKWLREIRIDDVQDYKVGNNLTIDIFNENEYVDVTGITKGKGFQGVVKRHNFKGGTKTHGQSNKQRSPGSIGSQRPQRVPKGRKMAGRMGGEKKTIKNLKILKIDKENNLLFIKGSVPGPVNSLVIVKKKRVT